MHEAVTHTSVFESNAIPINFNNSNNITNTDTSAAFTWPEIYDPDSDGLLDQNYLPANNYISPLSVTLEHLQRFSKSPPDLSSYLPVAAMNDNQNGRWRFNSKQQQADPTWMVADEIARLNIADVGGDQTGSPTRTPPKPALAGQAGNSSPNSSPPGREPGISHSRGSSIDRDSVPVGGNHVLNPSSLKGSPISELKERPHSFSGGLSSADLRKLQQAGDEGSDPGDQLQQQQWGSGHPRDGSANGEQLSYPSLSNNAAPIARNGAPGFDGRANVPLGENFVYPRVVPNAQGNLAAQGTQAQGNTYRQVPRTFPQQGALPSPTGMAFPVVAQAPHLQLGNPQQVYDMMLPGAGPEALNPALNRLQQQQNVFRGTHHHSSSDPSALRDAAALALLNGGVQAFAPMFPPMATPPALYGQFYGQDAYSRPSSTAAAAVAQAMAARLQSQYTGGYGMVTPQADQPLSPTPSSGGQGGPSANNRKLGLYKTELCRSWEEKGTCRYGAKCQFAHGEDELRKVARHPKYKTEICRTFWVSGSCPYGKRCCFIHTELPASGVTGANSATTETSSAPGHARTRSLSTNSDPNETSGSLLARISKRQEGQNPPAATGSVESPSFQNQRPPTGSLRVDTALDGASMKQNKSAYPTFASNGVLMANPEYIKAKSPAPLTAGPDLGRHNASRLEIVGYNNQRITKSTTPPSTNGQNNSYNEDGFSPSPPIPGQNYGLSGEGVSTSNPPRANGHVRAGSAGNWASLTRGSHLSSSSFPSPGGDGTITSPWSTTELAPVGASRLNDKTWG